MKEKPFCISHIKKDGEGAGTTYVYQSNEEHCRNVAALSEQFAAEFGMGSWGYLMGLLHDKGKEKQAFQEYIQDVNGIAGHTYYTNKEKAHAYVGGLIAKSLFAREYPLIGNSLFFSHSNVTFYFYICSCKMTRGWCPDSTSVCRPFLRLSGRAES